MGPEAWGLAPGGSGSHASPHDRRLVAVGLASVTATALVANCLFLGTKSIWLDEASSVDYALRGPLAGMTQILTSDPNMSLYYALLGAWVKLAGSSEIAIRIPSAVCAALTAPLVYLLGARLLGRSTGLLAGMLFALNAFIVHYGQTARAYALVTFLVTAATWLFVAELDRPSRLTRFAYVVTGALAFYAHLFAGLALVAHLVALLVIRGRSAFTRDTAFVAGSLAVLCAPMVFLVARVGDVNYTWIPQPGLATVLATFFEFAGASVLLFFVVVALVIQGAVALARERDRVPAAVLLAWLLVPVAVAFVLSQVKPLYQVRYFIGSVPAFMLIAAEGLKRLRGRFVGATGTLAVLGLSVAAVGNWYREESREDWRAAVNWITPLVHQGDGIVFMPPYAGGPFRYYEARLHAPHADSLSTNGASGRERVWLVTSPVHAARFPRELGEVRAALSAFHRLEAQESFKEVEIALFVRVHQEP